MPKHNLDSQKDSLTDLHHVHTLHNTQPVFGLGGSSNLLLTFTIFRLSRGLPGELTDGLVHQPGSRTVLPLVVAMHPDGTPVFALDVFAE